MLNRSNSVKASTSSIATSVLIIDVSFTLSEFTLRTIVIVMSNISNVEAKSKLTLSHDLQFECRDELIYYLIDDEKQRLCIFKIMQGEVFKLTHDQIHHEEFQ